MKRPVTSARPRLEPVREPCHPNGGLSDRLAVASRPRRGYTLIEILVATVLTLVMIGAVVRIFAQIGRSVADSRSTLEMTDQLRVASSALKSDLEDLTVRAWPPRHPESDEGHFEFREGPIGPDPNIGWGPEQTPHAWRPDPDNPNAMVADLTVGDVDDILMFTTRSTSRPFTGRALVRLAGGGIRRSAESQIAEVTWFVRGTTLYRRVLLVLPGFDADLTTPGIQMQLDPDGNEVGSPYPGFYANYDLSVHRDGNRLVANTLADLTRREYRFAHQSPGGFPFHPHFAYNWPEPPTLTNWATLGLPTLRECSASNWNAGQVLPPMPLTPLAAPRDRFDAWTNPYPFEELDPETGTHQLYYDPNSPRVAEDVILTNVIGFDVKLFDPGAPVITDGDVVLSPGDPDYATYLGTWSVLNYGAYVDLGYAPAYDDTTVAGAPQALFHRLNNDSPGPGPRSGLERVYDTWSFHYEHDGMDQFGDTLVDMGTNGFDDTPPGQVGYGVVDDPFEMETTAPYPYPARGIQIKIRVFEPDSRRVREVTVVQDFLPK